MTKKIDQRWEVNQAHTWDLSDLFESDDAFDKALQKLKTDASAFEQKYQGTLTTPDTINTALDAYRAILELATAVGTYQSLQLSANQQDDANLERTGKYQIAGSTVQNTLSFFESELLLNDEDTLQQAASLSEENKLYLEDLMRDKPHTLSPEVNKALTALSPVLDSSYNTYNRSKLADISFPDFTVKGTTYPMSFVSYENEFEFENDHELRHAAFNTFHGKLAEYQNTFAAIYNNQITKEKAMSELKGFESVFDYLLFDQKVSRDMYNRQIDLIMEHLAPHMRKYAKLLQRIHKLDKMTYVDLKLSVDPDFEPSISIEESKDYLLDGLAVLGDDYREIVRRSFDERWIDFPQNIGKSTGAFCSSPYGNHPYILINWTKRMREVFVLAHEVGHAGHFYLAGQNQNIYNTRASLYFIEAPSTMNELLMANHLKKSNDDPRFQRWILSSMIGRTYYHNFVTHLLEAAYQREVYRLVDNGQPVSTRTLSTLKKEVLAKFWGEDIEINDGAELTWMRQPHYFMGLYPYTYSAGLTIATEVSQKVIDGELPIDKWKDVLKAGGTKTPLELAKMVDVDLSTETPLLNTIAHIGAMIDEMVDLTDLLEKQ
ncbi:oligoendopeptidase F [Erysipelothrix sp. HDW6C]|uniref:oligoendopeptidase F n=1 Tax=Erysipelothrix sp. HDW6C TaxID=2714930 RepID=UPI00140B7BAE|nr:oligoendopeptidase F [Erysipelothrix sp. HDW6C]QIK70302.1 oligoendopeptidase F [Erysipelothrix sp. HDW6C]